MENAIPLSFPGKKRLKARLDGEEIKNKWLLSGNPENFVFLMLPLGAIQYLFNFVC